MMSPPQKDNLSVLSRQFVTDFGGRLKKSIFQVILYILQKRFIHLRYKRRELPKTL